LKSRILHLYGEETARHIQLFEKLCIKAHKIQMLGNYPEESMQHSEQGESLKSRILHLYGEETARHIRIFEKCRSI